MNGQATDNLQYIEAVENTSNYEPTPTLTYSGGYFKKKLKEFYLLQ